MWGVAKDLDQVLRCLLQAAAEPVLVDDQPCVCQYRCDGCIRKTTLTPTSCCATPTRPWYLAKQSGKNRFQFSMSNGQKPTQSRMGEGLRRCWQPSRADDAPVLPTAGRRTQDQWFCTGCGGVGFAGKHQRGLCWRTQFLPVIEGILPVSTLGEWVIHAALRQMAQWLTQRPDPCPSGVNIGAPVATETLPRPVAPGFAARIPPSRLTCSNLEVLETSALLDLDLVSRQMHACMAQGVVLHWTTLGLVTPRWPTCAFSPVQRSSRLITSGCRDMMVDP